MSSTNSEEYYDEESDSDYTPTSSDTEEIERKSEEDDIEFIEIDYDDIILEQLKQNEPELYDKFMEIQNYLESTCPSVVDILNLELPIKQKAQLIELYETMSSTEAGSYEYYQFRQNLKNKYNELTSARNKPFSEEEKEFVDSEIERMEKGVCSNSVDEQIAMLELPIEYKTMIYQKYLKIKDSPFPNDEVNKFNDWLQTIFKIPFRRYSQLSEDLTIPYISEQLDKHFYGMTKVKEQILIYVSNKLHNPHAKEYSLCLLGPPGTGKTYLALTLSKILSFPFYQLSGNMLNKKDSIHGHDYTYIGSQPGNIVKGLMRMNSMNGIFFIDEFEKLCENDNLSSLLQLLDPIQNHSFYDSYVGDIPIDISAIWFILSMNSLPENQALKDRLFIVNISGYTIDEKMHISKQHLIPSITDKLHIPLTIKDSAIKYVLQYTHTQNSGMRQVIHHLKDIFNKVQIYKEYPQLKYSFKIHLKKDNYEIDEEVCRDIIRASEIENTQLSMYI